MMSLRDDINYFVIYSDYGDKPELDNYEAEGLDDEGSHAELDYE